MLNTLYKKFEYVFRLLFQTNSQIQAFKKEENIKKKNQYCCQNIVNLLRFSLKNKYVLLLFYQ